MDDTLFLQLVTAMGGPKSATSTLSCTAQQATVATAWAARITPTVPTARGAGTASTASGVRRDVCPATATQLVSRGSKYLCTEVHASSSLFFSSWQTVGVKRDFFFSFGLHRKCLLGCIMVKIILGSNWGWGGRGRWITTAAFPPSNVL